MLKKAEFILAHGTEALGLSSGTAIPMKLEDLEKIFEQFAAKNIPMVVANPDFVTVEARALRVMPGKVVHLVYLIFMGLEHYSSVVRTG
ncbi:haloacid dehalogenase-like hydrolase (HAD) superfamily protein [Actinidia rufa]|uniref:Haloacid dehalogenase-like hydrolase (HAD) superfamily protein n=1 Tax=Actinidia rufa TaxID=165716 RepID=A0A7J0DZF2_9ERIC|nr:haloacid dehalogenase-like hydrolase (HAD) superfamily protein [Actinidia rufa]